MTTSSSIESELQIIGPQSQCKNASWLGSVINNFEEHAVYAIESVDEQTGRRISERVKVKQEIYRLAKLATAEGVPSDCPLPCASGCSVLERLQHAGSEIRQLLEDNSVDNSVSLLE